MPKRKKVLEGLSSSGSSTTSRDDQCVDASVPLLLINDLPEEILLEFFSYLGHSDRLVARQTCLRWSQIISSWKGFTKKVIFVVRGKATMSSWTLSQTTTLWEKLRLEKFRLDEKGYGNFILPPILVGVVKTVEFCKCVVSWEGLRHNLSQFHGLDKVKIVQCKRRRKEIKRSIKKQNNNIASVRTRARDDPTSPKSLVEVLASVKSFHFELRRISDMTFYLSQFYNHKVTSLRKLSLVEVYDAGELISPGGATELYNSILNLLKESWSTLTFLRINLSSMEVRKGLVSEVIDKSKGQLLNLCSLNMYHFAYNSTEEPQAVDKDIQMFTDFVKTQKNLVNIILPNPGYVSRKTCQTLARAIPQNVEKLHATSDKYMIPEFFKVFNRLKYFQCDFEIRQFLLSDQAYTKLRTFDGQNLVANISTNLIVRAFPNITRLNLNGNCADMPAIDDSCMQLICRELKKLRSLIIGASSRISDYGVTGIRGDYCKRLYRSRTLCISPEIDLPPGNRIGYSISDLKGLTELTFAESTSISDVGIFFGFRFKELRYLNLRDNEDISDWGVDWLAKLNPNLDFLYFVCGKWVTSVGISRLRSRLRRIEKRNCICIRPNDEYCSSDESYANESTEEN